MRMRLILLSAVLLGASGPARAAASTCEASYEVEGRKATKWFDLGEVSGAKKKINCIAKARNDAGNRKPEELNFPKASCADVPVSLSIFVRLEPKEKPSSPDAVIKTSFDLKCPPAKPK